MFSTLLKINLLVSVLTPLAGYPACQNLVHQNPKRFFPEGPFGGGGPGLTCSDLWEYRLVSSYA